MQIRLQWYFTWFYTAACKLNSTSINVHNNMLTKFIVGNNIKLYPVWVLIIVQTISLSFHASRSSIIHVNIAAIINAASRLIRMQHPQHCKFRTHHTKLGMHSGDDIPFYYNMNGTIDMNGYPSGRYSYIGLWDVWHRDYRNLMQ